MRMSKTFAHLPEVPKKSAGNLLLLTAGVLDTDKKRISGTLDSNVIFLGSPLMGLDFGRR
jgi:hypothetical protein